MPSDSIRPKASCVCVSGPVRHASECHVTRVVQIRLGMRHGSEVMAGCWLPAHIHTHALGQVSEVMVVMGGSLHMQHVRDAV